MPEWVNSEKWLKSCGLQLRWRGDDLLLGQPDFARELLDRHGPIAGRHIPLPKVDPTMDVEENINLVDVQKCQQLLGELLWLSGRTRPDPEQVHSVRRRPKVDSTTLRGPARRTSST